MNQVRRNGILAAALALLAGCATTQPQHGQTGLVSGGPSRPTASTGAATEQSGPAIKARSASPTTAFEPHTLYSCPSSTGAQIVFAQGRFFASVYANGGVIWVKPHSPLDTPGTLPTNPTPSAGSDAAGWIRLANGELVNFGNDPSSTQSELAPPSGLNVEQISFFDVWCEGGGDLQILGH